jgi:hypothetical protein
MERGVRGAAGGLSERRRADVLGGKRIGAPRWYRLTKVDGKAIESSLLLDMNSNEFDP